MKVSFIKEVSSRTYHFEQISSYLNSLEDNPYFVNYIYLEKELWVNDDDYPILCMPWIEGQTLNIRIAELCDANNKQALQDIANKFDKMALFLLNQEMAHGDLKPDNIIVTKDNQLVLVDYDGMFVPSLAGKKSPELGTAEYRHPKRTNLDFNKHLDDFPILVLSLSLHALAENPSLYVKSHGGDALLFKSEDYTNLLLFPHLGFFQQHAHNPILCSRFSMLMYSVTQPVLELVGLKELLEERASLVIGENLTNFSFKEESTEVKEEDGTYIDEYSVVYSANKKKLIQGNIDLQGYTVLKGTQVICDEAFYWCSSLSSINLPQSLTHIGYRAFSSSSLSSISLPESLTHIGEGAFSGCSSLSSISLPESLTHIGDRAFDWCSSLSSISLPQSLTSIGDRAFWGCSLSSISLPESLTHIGDSAFYNYSFLNIDIKGDNFHFIEGILYNKDKSKILFASNKFINKNIILPDSVRYIGDRAFADCSSLSSINLPHSLTHIGEGAFSGCSSLSSISLPKSLTHIGAGTFSYSSLSSINLPESLTHIGAGAFSYSSLSSINLPQSLTHIGDSAFSNCYSLSSISLPESLTYIGEGAFYNTSLSNTSLPQSLRHIGEKAFDFSFDLIF